MNFSKISIEELESYLDFSPNIFFKWKNKTNWPVEYVSSNVQKFLGYNVDDFLVSKLNYADIIHPDDYSVVLEEVSLYSKKSVNCFSHKPYRVKCLDGSYIWVNDTTKIVRDENGEISYYLGYIYDTTEFIEQKEYIENIAKTDSMTGFGNRFKLMNKIKNLKSPSLALLNIDSFSKINDFYGHHFGDAIIKDLAKIISLKIEPIDSSELFHLNADEFAILCDNCKKDYFLDLISDIIKFVNDVPLKIGHEKIPIQITSGISFLNNSDSLLTTADIALKYAKLNNKKYTEYIPSLENIEHYKDNLRWTNKLRVAIKDDNLIPFYQPIIDNASLKVAKYESLIRLVDENGISISPFFFLDIAKQTKQYSEITISVIRKSFLMFKDKDVDFSINITITDILDDDIQTFIFDMLHRYNISKRVIFELVETEGIENFREINTFITKVKDMGCKIAIDDFGTGYSNFIYLMRLKADYIKIDGTLVRNLDTDEKSKIVVSTIVDFAKKLGIKTVAEFVETKEIFDIVKNLGVDYSQGYYFSKPKETLS